MFACRIFYWSKSEFQFVRCYWRSPPFPPLHIPDYFSAIMAAVSKLLSETAAEMHFVFRSWY
jgi:hypothetical protein